MPRIPGAELLEVSDDGSTYKGRVSVKLGPVALAFVGTAMFAERNQATREARLKCKGNDAKGRGGVQADMTFRVAEESLAATHSASSESTRLIAPPERVASGAHQLAAGIARLDTQRQPTSPPQPVSVAKPIPGFALLFKVLRSWLSGLFRERP
jgi:hypothetical protein